MDTIPRESVTSSIPGPGWALPVTRIHPAPCIRPAAGAGAGRRPQGWHGDHSVISDCAELKLP